ncbi:MAG: CDP-diacylglycerol--glycerol-3-phosphate 3-phosphatidyltransferase [Phycisphaerales bacterium]|nr:CDP-diacylglycerol--glycerol-3-phosphate 3-phosphatidyltransferase [Planctomycetota bacterium]MCH8509435.1 CDP-diacylglycerol--glycerol-3-phosphate 3-phosphatidyltransferase [Phycisphaerales bacterium]
MNPNEMRIQQRVAPGPMPQPTRKVHIPNLLTLGRLVIAIVVVILLSSVSARALRTQPSLGDRLGDLTHASTAILVTAAVLFVIAALTDALDGHLARKWKVESKFGRVMDPLADKLLVLGAFIMLAGPGFTSSVEGIGRIQVSAVAGWMVFAMVGRELLVTSIRAVYEADGVDFAAGWSGKAKMILQSAAVPLILLIVAFASPGPDTPARTFLVMLMWITTGVTLVSAGPYIWRAMQHTVQQQQKMMQLINAHKPRKPTAMPSPKTRDKKPSGGGQAKRRKR